MSSAALSAPVMAVQDFFFFELQFLQGHFFYLTQLNITDP